MISFPKKRGSSVALLVAGLLLVSLPEAVPGKSKITTAGKPSATQQTAVKPGAPRKSAQASFRAGRRKRRSSFKHRLARLRLEPQRVEEIQQALIQMGYLNQEPNGKWDDATRDAMRRFQAAHGFPSTGLPEAKSLMKLGLGPHPLPAELDPTARAQASAATAPPANSPVDLPKTDSPEDQ